MNDAFALPSRSSSSATWRSWRDAARRQHLPPREGRAGGL